MKEALRFRDNFLLLLAVLVLIGFSHSGIAQLYPIQVNTSLTAPFTPYLADYTNPGTQKLMVQVRVNDPTLSDYTGKFRITIEGVGITIRTKPTFVPQPVRLQGGGIPQVFYGEDLYEYFNPNNLDFAGITRTEFNKTGKLPEGVYRFTVEVLDYNRGTVVSNKGVTLAWIILNDPPLLNLPRKETKVRIIDPTNIPFTWTPRHTGSPNSAFTTEYIFRLVEIWPINRNPYDAFLSQPPLYEFTTTQTQIVYGPAEPALIPGRKYAWQVQAKDTEGRDLFKNQGRSEVFVFQFGDALGAPENVRNETMNASALGLKWEPAAQGEMPTQYRVRYRPKGEYNSWYEAVTDQRWVTLSSLKAATDYEVQVRAEASPQVSEYSRVVVMKTEEAGSSEFSCGNETVVSPAENIGPLLILRPGDVISCRNFKVVVTEAQGSTGSFTGKGMMQVPMFSGASVWVTFASSKINRNYELTAGEVSTVYNHGSTMAQVVDEMHRIGEEKLQPKTESDSVTITPAIAHTIPGVIDSIYFDHNKGEVVVIDQQGNESMYKIPIDPATGGKQPLVFTDSAGNTYAVDRDGNVNKSTTSNIAGTIALRPIKEQIIVLILDQFEEEINAWLRINGKGGDEDPDILLADELPECFPRDADILKPINESTIPYFNDHPAELCDKIEYNQNNKQLFDRIAALFKNEGDVDWNKIEQTDQNFAQSATFEALITSDIVSVVFSRIEFSGERHKNIPNQFNTNSVCYFGESGGENGIPVNFKLTFNPKQDHTARKFLVKAEVYQGSKLLNSKFESTAKKISQNEYSTDSYMFLLEDKV